MDFQSFAWENRSQNGEVVPVLPPRARITSSRPVYAQPVSVKNKVIFIHIPKAAGSSVEEALGIDPSEESFYSKTCDTPLIELGSFNFSHAPEAKLL